MMGMNLPRWPLFLAAFLGTFALGSAFGVMIEMDPLQETTWDIRIESWVLEHRPDHSVVTRLAKAITKLGNLPFTATALSVIVLSIVIAQRRGSSRIDSEEAPFWLVVAVGGQLMNWGLKILFRRDRPPSSVRLVPADFYSFPSGHGTFAGVSLILASVVIVRVWRERSRAGVIIAIVLVTVLALAVAASRVWLGVHYASDVAVGLFLGLVWSASCHMIRFVRPALPTPAPLDDAGSSRLP
jgi:undecaprenyl-diphosphatase